MNDPTIRVTTMLVMNGFDYDIAESWSDQERLARVIIIGEINGRVWDWGSGKWRPPPT